MCQQARLCSQRTIILVMAICLVPAMAPIAFAGPVQLAPSGLNPGDTYHLAFVTNARRNASSGSIAVYDNFVQNAADNAGIGVGSPIGDIDWKVLGATAPVNGQTHANVQGPVFRLDDTLIATGAADLWNGSLAAPISLTEFGVDGGETRVWTGMLASGTAPFQAGLGAGRPRYGNRTSTSATWAADSGTVWADSTLMRVYGISEALTFVPEPGSLVLFAIGGLVLIRRRR